MKAKAPSKSRKPRVSELVARYARMLSLTVSITKGHRYAETVSQMAGDCVKLDSTEQALIELKRRDVISGPKMVKLLGQHQVEIKT